MYNYHTSCVGLEHLDSSHLDLAGWSSFASYCCGNGDRAPSKKCPHFDSSAMGGGRPAQTLLEFAVESCDRLLMFPSRSWSPFSGASVLLPFSLSSSVSCDIA